MKKLLILSGKGGTGKTTTAAAFIHFANAKAIADCDVDAPNLHIVSSMKEEPIKKDFYGSKKAHIDTKQCVSCGLCVDNCRFSAITKENDSYHIDEYACEGCGVCEYVCPQKAITLQQDVAGLQQLYIGDTIFSTAKLKMGRGNSGKLVTEVKKEMITHANEDTEIAIIDGSPGIGCPVIASVTGVDLVLVVAEPSLSGLSDLKRLIKTAQTLQVKLVVCINKWNSSIENAQAIEEFCQEEQIPFVGKIPYDKTASIAMNSGKSIAEMDGPAKKALYEVYQNVMEILL